MVNISQIKDKIKRGDIGIASVMLGISSQNASQAYRRAESKHHQNLIEALAKVIDMREKLINEGLVSQ